ncbi:hypothetical protein [Streptomyces buecherae]|uniref:hypothetical protein n=1 Tax=Streptomyces buecherae TaxID=2763006 RepID=UPI003798B3B8
MEAILDELHAADAVGCAELLVYTYRWNDMGVAGLSLVLGAARIATLAPASAGSVSVISPGIQ